MAWVATITDIKDDDTSVKVNFSFSNGKETRLVADRGFENDSQIKNYIVSQIRAYENKAGITIKVNDTFDLSSLEPVKKTPSVEDIFFSEKQKLAELKRELDLKLIDQETFDKKAAEVKLLKP